MHLIGPGEVGRAFLTQLAAWPTRLRLVAVTDSSGTLHARAGLDPLAIRRHKAAGGRLADLAGAEVLPLRLATSLVGADVVVDATPSDLAEGEPAARRCLDTLRRGRAVALAAKAAVCRAPDALLGDARHARIGIDAVLGGTGAALAAALPFLRRHWQTLTLVGNASTTAVIEAVETGASLAAGIAAAQAAGILEPDPELDLSGRDAAVKLAIVVGLLRGRPVDVDAIATGHIGTLDPEALRRDRRQGWTTRLISRADRGGALSVAYERVPHASILAAPPSSVVYVYDIDDGTRRVHVGTGVGPEETAAALLRDVLRLSRDTGPEPEAEAEAASVNEAGGGAGYAVTPQTKMIHLPARFPLALGGELRGAQLAFESCGPKDGPVVIVLGGISADRHVTSNAEDPRPGWWEEVVGPGRAIDTRTFRVIGIDWLLGGGVPTGPIQLPLPVLSSFDQAEALACLLDRLAVPRVHRIVGASFGGMVGLAFAARHPARVEGLICIAAAHESHPMASAWRGLQRRIVDLGRDPAERREALAVARGLAMTTYRSHEEFATRFTAAAQRRDGGFVFPVEDYLRSRGEEFAARVSPEAFQALSLAIDLHRVDPEAIRTPTLLIGISTDRLVPSTQVAALAARLGEHGRFVELTSDFGHDGFLKEVDALTRILAPAVVGKVWS